MIVTTIDDCIRDAKFVDFDCGISVRPIVEEHKMGYSVHKTIMKAGVVGNWHYKQHLETCYCIKGLGALINSETNERHIIKPDTIYALNDHDKHTLEVYEDMVLISIFNPPVIGHEIHNPDGSYEI